MKQFSPFSLEGIIQWNLRSGTVFSFFRTGMEQYELYCIVKENYRHCSNNRLNQSTASTSQKFATIRWYTNQDWKRKDQLQALNREAVYQVPQFIRLDAITDRIAFHNQSIDEVTNNCPTKSIITTNSLKYCYMSNPNVLLVYNFHKN